MSIEEMQQLSKLLSDYMDEHITLLSSDHFPCEIWIAKSVQGETFVVIDIEGRKRIHRVGRDLLSAV